MNCRELASQITTCLGSSWTLREDDNDTPQSNNTHIDGQDGEALFLSLTWVRGKLHIAGCWPSSIPYEVWSRASEKRPSINVSPEKAPSQIAKDIQRRLLSDYRRLLVVVRQQYSQHQAWIQAKETLIERVCGLFGVEYRPDRDLISSQGKIDVQVSSGNSMRLYGHCTYLTFDQLKRFREAVPELFEREHE